MRGGETDQDKDRKAEPDPGRPRSALRRRAEKSLEKRESMGSRALSPEEEQRMIHELQVHQIELEMQNEELQDARRNAEEAQEKYRALYDFAPVGYLTLGRGGRILELNLTGSLILGKPRAHIVERRFQSFLTRESIPVFNAFSTKVLETAERQTCEVGIPSNGDEVRFFRIEGTASHGGYGAAQIQVALIDITESRRAGEELRTTLQRFYTVLSSMYSSILLVADDGRVEFANQAFCDLFDLKESPADLTGLTSHEMIEKIKPGYLYPEEEVERIREILGRGEPVKGEEIAMKDGRACLRDFIPLQVGGKSYGRLWHHTDITRRKTAEDELRRKQTEIQALFENTPAGLVLFDATPPYTVLVHNRYYQELFAEPFRSQGMVGLSVYEYAPAVEAEGVVAVFDEVVRTKQAKSFLDFPYRSHPPKESWFNWYMAPIILDGKVVALVSMSLDVTDRHLAEAALRESEFRYRTVADNTYDWEFWLDPEGKFIYCSPSCEMITGHRESEFIADPGLRRNLIHPDDRAGFEEHQREVHANRRIGKGQWRYLRPDGTACWVEHVCQPVYGAKGEFLGIRGSNRDITDRKKAEEQLASSYAYLDQILQSLNDAFYALDREWRFTFVNRHATTMIGMPDGELLGRTIWEAFPGIHGTPLGAAYRKAMEEKVPVHLENLSTVKKGHWFAVDIYPLVDGISIFGREITERVKAEEALREAKDRTETILMGIADTFYSLDDQWRFTTVNPAAERAPFGRPAAELLGKVIWDLYPALVGTRIHRHYLDAAEKHTLEHYEARSPLNGRWYEVFMQGRKGGVDVYMRDITDRRRAEEALLESGARFRALAESMPQIVWSADAAGNMDYYNPRAYEYGGVGPDEVKGWNWESLIHPDDLPATVEAWKRALEKGETSVVEHRLRRADGEYRWHLTRGAAIRDDQGSVTRWIGTATDIHDLKQAQESLLRSSEWLGIAQQAAHSGVWHWDIVSGQLTWSDELFHLFGMDPSAGASFDSWSRAMHEADRAAARVKVDQAVREKTPLVNEYRVVHPGGEVRWIGAWGNTSYDEAGRPLSMSGICIDITERKKADQALRESEERYRALADSAPEAILVHYHGGLLYANQLALDLYGASSLEELKSHDILELVPPEEREVAMERVKGIDEGKRLPMREGAILRLDGTRVPIEVVSAPIRYEGIQAAQALMRDITDRKQAEERIAHLASFPEMNPNPVVELNSAGEVIYANPAAMKTIGTLNLGTDPAALLPENISFMLPRLMEGDVTEEVGAGGRVFLETVTLNPRTRTMRIYARDITDRKRVEEAMRETGEYLENLINYANAPIIVWDPQFRITRFNHAFERLTGRTAEEVVGQGLEILFPAESIESSIDHIQSAMAGERWEVVEIPILHRDGSVRTVLWNSATLYEADGKTVSSAIAQGQDITERKLVEDALRETSQYLENLINYANAPIIVWDPQFRITRFNQASERLTGRSAEGVIGTNLEDLFPPETVAESMDLIRKAMGGERWEAVEIPVLRKDGETRMVLWNSATLYEADGETVSSAIAQGQDITERKRMVEEIAQKAGELADANAVLSTEISQRKEAEEEVRKTLSILHAALESTADAILVADKSGRITSHNQNFTTMWHIPESVLHTLDTRVTTERLAAQARDPDGFAARLEEIFRHPSMESYDMLELLDGRIIERYSKPQRIGSAIVGRVFSFRDITERKRQELSLIQSLNEKEVLLREIHHRVKNNLQLTTSLLDMTRMRTEDPVTGGILTDIMMKIQTMAQIHTRLYESKQFDRINMDRQIRDQVQSLTNIYGSSDREIRVEIDSPELYLPLDQAIPCALALNEILSNAYKHAFKGLRSGTVKFRAGKKGGLIRFTISDNGVGLPEGFDLGRTNTLGLKLVRTLVEKQLRGTLRMTGRKKGTEVIVEIPEKGEEEDVKDTRG